MKAMNNLMRVPQIAATFRELQKEMMKVWATFHVILLLVRMLIKIIYCFGVWAPSLPRFRVFLFRIQYAQWLSYWHMNINVWLQREYTAWNGIELKGSVVVRVTCMYAGGRDWGDGERHDGGHGRGGPGRGGRQGGGLGALRAHRRHPRQGARCARRLYPAGVHLLSSAQYSFTVLLFLLHSPRVYTYFVAISHSQREIHLILVPIYFTLFRIIRVETNILHNILSQVTWRMQRIL